MTDATNGEDNEIKQGKNFVDAAKKVGLEHVVFSSSAASNTEPNSSRFRSKYEVSLSIQRLHEKS
jgi:uncharacterized protein YbjT (DUF2867 family)